MAEVDEHVARLLETLEKKGLREETLVVITANPGEDFVETGPRGERRVGHVDTVSDNVLTVPLLFVNPTLKPERVRDSVSFICLFDVLVNLHRDGTPEIVRQF